MKNYFTLLLLLAVCAYPNKVFAGGFLIYGHDAAALALGLAYTAQVKNPSAVLYNPAAINQIEGTSFSTGGTLINSHVSFRVDSTGNKTNQDSDLFFIPAFFATKKLNDRWSIGIGSFSPYGLTSNWPGDWDGRYLATFAQLRSFFLNPVVSCQLTPKLSFAGGFNIIYSDVYQRKNIKITPFRDGGAKFKGDDFGWGYNIGLLYQITDKFKFGAAYRSTIRMDYVGDVTFRVPKLIESIVPEGRANINIDLPGFLTTGLCYSPNKKWSIEFDVFWIDWSQYDSLDLKYSKPVRAIMRKQAAPIVRDYHDTYDFCLGVSYRATETITLRAGYLFDESPVPEKSQDPILYDADKHFYSLGIGLQKGKWTVDIAGYLCFYEDQNISRNQDKFNGKFKAFLNTIALSITYAL